jgi:hypothetical protein
MYFNLVYLSEFYGIPAARRVRLKLQKMIQDTAICVAGHLPLADVFSLAATCRKYYCWFNVKTVRTLGRKPAEVFPYFQLYHLSTEDCTERMKDYVDHVRWCQLNGHTHYLKSLRHLLATMNFRGDITILDSVWIQRSGVYAALLSNADFLENLAEYLQHIKFHDLVITSPLPHECHHTAHTGYLLFFYYSLVEATKDILYINKQITGCYLRLDMWKKGYINTEIYEGLSREIQIQIFDEIIPNLHVSDDACWNLVENQRVVLSPIRRISFIEHRPALYFSREESRTCARVEIAAICNPKHIPNLDHVTSEKNIVFILNETPLIEVVEMLFPRLSQNMQHEILDIRQSYSPQFGLTQYAIKYHGYNTLADWQNYEVVKLIVALPKIKFISINLGDLPADLELCQHLKRHLPNKVDIAIAHDNVDNNVNIAYVQKYIEEVWG